MLKLFFKFELEKIAKYFKEKTLAKVITGILGLVVFLFVMTGVYTFFASGIRYINADSAGDVKNLLLLFVYEILFLFLAGIIIFSTLISGIFKLFRGQNDNWVLSSSSYKLFPTFILIRSSITSLFPLSIVFIPAMVAFIQVNNLGLVSVFFVLFSIVLFLITMNLVTLLFLIVTGFSYYKVSQKVRGIICTVKGFILLLSLGIVIIATYIWSIFKHIDLVQLFKAENVDTTASLSTITTIFVFLPTSPLAQEVLNWQNGKYIEALSNFGSLVVIISVLSLVWYLVSPLFYPLWLKFQEGDPYKESYSSSLSTRTRGYIFKGTVTSILFKKEALVLLRNWKGILWFLFLSCIWLAQIGSNVIIGHTIQKYQPDISQKILLLQVLQYIIAIYFISSFTLRFVFPSFSVEKKTSWVLGTAPLNFVKIFFGKYFFYTIFLVSLGIIMSYINVIVLGISSVHALYSVALFVSTTIFIITVGLSAGALFPNSESDDPEVISTSMPGLIFTAFSLIYGACSDVVLYQNLKQDHFFWVSTFIVANVLITTVLLQKISVLTKHKIF